MNKGQFYSFQDGKNMMCIVEDMVICPDCLTCNGFLKINLKDFPLTDIYECFGDYLGEIIEDLCDKE